MLWLSQTDVLSSGITDMAVASGIVRKTLGLVSEGKTVSAQEVPLRLSNTGTDEAFYSLPAYVGGGINIAGIKWTTHHPGNKANGQPHIYTVLLLNDPSCGLPLTALEGSIISAMRTGAVSAVAFQELANPDSRTLFCGGAGVQARQQVRGALYAVPGIERVDIFSRSRDHAQNLANELAIEYPSKDFRAVISPDESGLAYDILIGATSAPHPYLEERHFKDGCLYCHIGLRDIKPKAVNCFDRIVLDEFQAGVPYSGQSLFVQNRTGEFNQEKLDGLLHEYVTGQRKLRQQKGQRIMFDGFGMSIFDIALGAYAYEYARQNGLGSEMPLWQNAPIWR